jgi:peptide/nickel transport system permease protein
MKQATVDFISKNALAGRGESLMAVYWRRYKKHTLGKIGGIVLILLYLSAILADFLSPFDMSWTDKTKSYHPLTGIRFIYRDRGKTVFRPFVYEKRLVNKVYKRYGVVPERAIRVISLNVFPGRAELRTMTLEDNPAGRREVILAAVGKHYALPPNHVGLVRLAEVLDELERNQASDVQVRFRLGTERITGREIPIDLILAKGNKNFLGFFFRGIPYRFLGLFTTTIHFFGSSAGGAFFLGADQFGRDVLSRLLHGSRISLSVGLLGALISFSIGLIIGGVAGYFGGAIDNVLMRLAEVVQSFPSLYLLFALRATFPPTISSGQVYLLIVMIISFVLWAPLSRIIRGLVLAIKNEEYVLSAKSVGLSDFKIIRRHILPNTLSYIIIQATLTIPGFILGESALSLLGLGITEPQASWGLMLAVARNYRVVSSFPWILVPGFAIFIAIMAWNFFGDGIRDAVDPRSRH